VPARRCAIAAFFADPNGDMPMRHLKSLVTLAGLMACALVTVSRAEDSGPPPLDPAWKVPEVIAFIGVKKGDQVADIIGGRLTGSLAQAVGPSGKVYAVETAEVVKGHPQVLDMMHKLAEKSPNVVVSAEPVSTPLPSGLDAVFIRQNYHDLYDKFMGPADVAAFNKAVFAALKPGGVYVVLDHAAAAGSGISATDTLHRIDPARVKADVLAAGFKLQAQSSILANKDDDHTKNVFDPSIRNHTDQFLFRFKKPK
jgi:predicted methyltransferase